MGDAPKLLLDVVVSELEYRAKQDGPTSQAAIALTQLGWLGEPAETSAAVSLKEIVEMQTLIADGKVLKHEREHWAESVAIAMMKRSREVNGNTHPKIFLTEDYSARIQGNKEPDCTPVSIHGLLWNEVKAGRLTAHEAERLSTVIQELTGNAANCTAADFASPTRRDLGRVGQP